MNTKGFALFFVFLFCSEYVLTATATLIRHKRQSGCTPNKKLEELFDKCFDDVRAEMDDSFSLGENVVGNLQLANGQAKGFKNFKRGQLTCTCFPEFLRVFIELSFLDITVTFVATLLQGVLGGILGNLGNTLARLVSNLVGTVINLVALEINVVIVVDHRFEHGSHCVVTDYDVVRISAIKLLNIDLTQLLINLLGEILTPVVRALITNLLDKQVRAIITKQIEKISISKDMYKCQ